MASINQLESFDSGSNYNFDDSAKPARNPSSAFDLSHNITTTLSHEGVVYPLQWLPTIPNDSMDINVDSLLRVMPQAVPLYSRQRLYVYAVHSRLAELWDNFIVFIKKGYDGKTIKLIPTFNEINLAGSDTDKIKPNSLGDMLGLPQGLTRAQIKNGNISCLSAMAFLRFWRDYMINRNYYVNDRIILPDDDSRFRLGDDGNLLSCKDVGKYVKFDLFSDVPSGIHYDDDGNLIVGLFFHDWPSDRFTRALSSPQRGDESEINLDVKTELDFSKILSPSPLNTNYKVNFEDSTVLPQIGVNGTQSVQNNFVNMFNKIDANTTTAKLSLNMLRELSINQTVMEKLAKTDGSYSQFGLAMFGTISRSAQDYRPQYVGGTYKNITFTEVLQTSESTDNSPLGSMAGHGITGINNTYLGHLNTDDYGILTFFACIMPDVYYSQGLNKKWSISQQSDMFLPERAKLGMVPILNKELYYAGNNGSNQGQDDYLWGYTNIYDEFRYEPNIIKGKIADTTNESFYPYTQSRYFTQLMNWGKEFANASDIRSTVYSAPDEDHYTAQFKLNIRAVRDLPYQPTPAALI